jgi:FixJ family two-component response regulator
MFESIRLFPAAEPTIGGRTPPGGSAMHENTPVVFVVDDDRSARESLSDLIRSAGLNVQTFASAQVFLTSRRPAAPSCLVLDVQLPGFSGLELQQELARVRGGMRSTSSKSW